MAPLPERDGSPENRGDALDEGEDLQLAQQFKSTTELTSYMIARMQQADPQALRDNMPVLPDNPVDETEEEIALPARKERRIKGRRRAINPDARVEAALRRQLDLKTSFRSLARPLKQILDVMGQRTTDILDTDSRAHENAIEFATVERDLQDRLDRRTTILNRSLELQRRQLQERYDAEERLLRSGLSQLLRDTQDRIMDDVDHDLVRINRQSNAVAAEDTDDEDGVIVRPHTVNHRYQRGPAIDPRYDSRSQLGLDVEQAHEHMRGRSDMRDMLSKEDLEHDTTFTIMDTRVRDFAQARREGRDNVQMLVRATEAVEGEARRSKRRKYNTPAHKDDGLMALAEVASKHGTDSKFMPPPSTPRRPSVHGRNGDDMLHYYGSLPGSLPSTHKRNLSESQRSLPSLKRPYMQPYTIGNTESEIKDEEMPSPAPRLDAAPFLSHTSLPPKPVMDLPAMDRTNRFDRPPYMSHPYEHRAHTSKEERGGLSRAEYERRLSMSSLRPGQPSLASPFGHPASLAPTYPPAPAYTDWDRYPPMEYNHRPMLPHPPMPPTAQPVNHFANNGIHRYGFSMPPPSGLSPAYAPSTPSPLVALPRGEAMPPQMSWPPSYGSYGPSAGLPMQNAPQQSPVSQYGGLALAPAAGPFATPQPAFAQQLGRDQKRRNTEGSVTKFRQYHGPREERGQQ